MTLGVKQELSCLSIAEHVYGPLVSAHLKPSRYSPYMAKDQSPYCSMVARHNFHPTILGSHRNEHLAGS
jgi:hypothetical protein